MERSARADLELFFLGLPLESLCPFRLVQSDLLDLGEDDILLLGLSLFGLLTLDLSEQCSRQVIALHNNVQANNR